jgi:hypothetical protein
MLDFSSFIWGCTRDFASHEWILGKINGWLGPMTLMFSGPFDEKRLR